MRCVASVADDDNSQKRNSISTKNSENLRKLADHIQAIGYIIHRLFHIAFHAHTCICTSLLYA